MSIEFRPIGFVRMEAEEIPRHWSVSDVEGTLVIDEKYEEGLRGIRPGQRIVVIFNFDRSPRFSPEFLRQRSGQSGEEMGVFSICSPVRPNPIGMSILEVLGVEGANVGVGRLDALDGTPILDIKPHIRDEQRANSGGPELCCTVPGRRLRGAPQRRYLPRRSLRRDRGARESSLAPESRLDHIEGARLLRRVVPVLPPRVSSVF